MRSFFAKHIGSITFGAFLNLPFLWKAVVWATDWLGRLDFWNTHGREIAGISAMIGFLIDPPPYTVFLTGLAAALIVAWDVRRQAKTPETEHPTDPVRGLKVMFYSFCAALFLVAWVPAWSIYFPLEAKPPEQIKIAELTKPVPVSKPRQTTSNAGRTIYRCEPQGPDSPKYIEKGKDAYKKEMAVYGDSFGFTISVTDVLGGIKMEAVPKSVSGPLKTTIEVRNIGDDTYVIRTQVFPEPYGSLYAMELTFPDSDKEAQIRKTISRMPGVDIATCKLL